MLNLPKEAGLLFERLEGGGGRPTKRAAGGTLGRPAAAGGGKEERAEARAEALRRAGAPASQQGAIDQMKLAQQLRNAERELDKVTRLHLIKSRRVMELEHEVEAYHSGLEGKKHDIERLGLERDAALRQRDESARHAEERSVFRRVRMIGVPAITVGRDCMHPRSV